jgi:hypothetical protein
MTQKEANILVEIITKVVRKELGTFRKQLLQEGYSPQPVRKQVATQPADRLTEVHKNFRNTVRLNNAPKKNMSKNPLLNSILQETISIEEAERQADEMAILESVNLPVDINGRLISSNANVDHVLEAMNRDYSGMFAQKGKSTPASVAAKNQLRNDFLAAIEDDFLINDAQKRNRTEQSTYPSVEPFSKDEEDLDWLNYVS